MNSTPTKAWVCTVCGYIHYGDRPPEECPVCGSPSEMFELAQAGPAAQTQASSVARVIVAGAGIAGVSAAEALHQASPTTEILLVSNEADLPYYRLNLTRYLAGEIGPAELPLHPESWYAENSIQLIRGQALASVDVEQKAAILSDGRREHFDRLILATGSHPFVPPFPGVERTNVFTLRTWQDANHILAAGRPGMACVVIGGGLLGLETAGALARRGLQVNVLENQEWLLPRQLNRIAAGKMVNHLNTLGIKVTTQARTHELTGDGSVQGVRLESGELIPAELVLISAGVRSNVDVARAAGLQVAQGVVVDDAMKTSHPDVFAAGDLAEHQGVVYGIWPPSQAQGTTAGANAAGEPSQVFKQVPRSNSLKVLGIDLFSIGRFMPGESSDRAIEGETGQRYACFNFNGQHLVGAILLGDDHLALRVKKVIESQMDCSGWLKPSTSAADILDILQQFAED